jgi:hypothetical protein
MNGDYVFLCGVMWVRLREETRHPLAESTI